MLFMVNFRLSWCCKCKVLALNFYLTFQVISFLLTMIFFYLLELCLLLVILSYPSLEVERVEHYCLNRFLNKAYMY